MEGREKDSRSKVIVDSFCDTAFEEVKNLGNDAIRIGFQVLGEKLIGFIKSKPDKTETEIRTEMEKMAREEAVKIASKMLDQSSEMGEYIYRTAVTSAMKDLEWEEETIQQVLKLADKRCNFNINRFLYNASNSHSKRN